MVLPWSLSVWLETLAVWVQLVVLEGASLFSGATAVSGGQVWVPGHHHRAVGTATDRERLQSYCLDHSHERPVAVIEAFLDAAPTMARFVEQHNRSDSPS